MAYVEGFVTAVPADNRDIYIHHAEKAGEMIRELGASRMFEGWGDQVPDGKLTDFKRTVKAKPDEVVLFSWFEYPDRAARDATNEKMMDDPRMEAMMQDMPFDASRMIYAGFEVIIDEGAGVTKGGKPAYVDGSLLPVPEAGKDAYRAQSVAQAQAFIEQGALRVVGAWGDDVPDGKVTDYKGAVLLNPGEVVTYNWIEWPSRAVRDAAWGNLMSDARFEDDASALPTDGQMRRVYGGFEAIVDV
ncbi:DUF1428 domain-containing protein [Asticcacaulis endophyticus]|uniref:DUF1428 domain-containing protein n=1 Tax=Asticcacaulis endophyticus TaxID=1395890 RepID=A0A918PTT4_9CAUL|nr:DUF1428 domain-containing protein [Asticcacaulis endophyticus]GGZ20296.1 hypothetical protein GCM10011273_01090 [Asticcacaulis endophyticus]